MHISLYKHCSESNSDQFYGCESGNAFLSRTKFKHVINLKWVPVHSNSALVNLGLESGCMTDAWYLNIYYKSVGTHGPIIPPKFCSIWNKGKSLNMYQMLFFYYWSPKVTYILKPKPIKCGSFMTGPPKLFIFWCPIREQMGFFYDCPPKLLTFRRPCNSIWILEFWRRNRRKRQSHKILISVICRSELELRNFTNFKWIIMGQLLRGFLKDGV